MFFFSTFPGAEVLINLSYLELRASLAFNRATHSQNSVYLYRHRCIFGFRPEDFYHPNKHGRNGKL